MQKARGQPFPLRGIGLPQLASLRFQVLFHSHSWVLFNFPSQYLCTIGCQRVFSLGRWTGRILTRFHVSGDTWEHNRQRCKSLVYGAITLYRGPFQGLQLLEHFLTLRPSLQEGPIVPHNPHTATLAGLHGISLGFSLFARRYLGNIFVFCSSGY
jgi:hypothetical protein